MVLSSVLRKTPIDETANYFVLWKNKDFEPKGNFRITDTFVELGENPSDKTNIRIRRIVYPKPKYTREKVEEIAQSTIDCPHCNIGHGVEEKSPEFETIKNETDAVRESTPESSPLLPSEIIASSPQKDLKTVDENIDINTEFLTPSEEEKPMSMQNFSLSRWADVIGPSLAQNVVPQGIATLVKAGTSLSGSTANQKLANGLIGGGGLLAANLVPQIKSNPRLQSEMNSLFTNLLMSIFDVRPGDSATFGSTGLDWSKLQSSFAAGQGLQGLQDMFKFDMSGWNNFVNSLQKGGSFALPEFTKGAMPAGITTAPVSLPISQSSFKWTAMI